MLCDILREKHAVPSWSFYFLPDGDVKNDDIVEEEKEGD